MNCCAAPGAASDCPAGFGVAAQLQANDEAHLRRAICESAAAIAPDSNAMPFGAVLAKPSDAGCVLAARNACLSTGKRGGASDVTRHAEMELVRKMCLPVEQGGIPTEQRSEYTFYTSNEPCVMCTGAIYWSGVRRVVYGCSNETLTTMSGPGGFDIPVRDLYSRAPQEMEVVGPVLEDEAVAVHRRFGWFGNVPNADDNVGSASEVDGEAKQLAEIDIERSLMRTGLGARFALFQSYFAR
eukprot:SAG31_NODE_2641_length_5326_cov_9.734647_6_plen_241_part_00